VPISLYVWRETEIGKPPFNCSAPIKQGHVP
jgi:hypothetical protein